MKRHLLGVILCLSILSAQAQQRDFMNHLYDYLENLDVFELGQEEGRAYFIPEHHKLLNGQWEFFYADTPEGIPANFYQTSYSDRKWTLIDVPSNWEMRGWGDPLFRNVTSPFKANPPYVPREYNPLVLTAPHSRCLLSGVVKRSSLDLRRWLRLVSFG